jgi:hypothetical protein
MKIGQSGEMGFRKWGDCGIHSRMTNIFHICHNLNSCEYFASTNHNKSASLKLSKSIAPPFDDSFGKCPTYQVNERFANVEKLQQHNNSSLFICDLLFIWMEFFAGS